MLLSVAERLLNEQITESTAAAERLEALDGKRFAIAVEGGDLRIVMTAAGGRLRLDAAADAECDVELRAGPLELLRLARSAELSDLRRVNARLDGEIGVAEAFADLLRIAVPEPEALAADWIGDMPAHAAAGAARRLHAWGAATGRAFALNLVDFLQEESLDLTPPALSRQFGDDVERLRDDVARAERRVVLLEQRRRQGRAGS